MIRKFDFSKRFCLLGHFIAEGSDFDTETLRPKQRDDFINFSNLVQPVYKSINWFSFAREGKFHS